jgi:hypothetical protein
MRKLFVSLSLSVLFFNVFAQKLIVSQQSACERFMMHRAMNTNFAQKTFVLDDSDYFMDSNGDTAIVICHFVDGGFLMLSAEKNVYPVLAYSFENDIDINNMPLGFRNWVQNVIFQIENVRKYNKIADVRIENAWRDLYFQPEQFQVKSEGVEPLLHTKWNQGKYYNTACPEDPAGPDDHALTGCVATALGQLMNYFRHPQQGEGYYSYIDSTYGFLEVEFSEQYYNWDEMGNVLNSYNMDVANLLHHIGVSVDMRYGPNGSGMYNHKGAFTLSTYFGYADSTQYFFRDSLNEDFDWVAMLIEHLDQDIPLYYAGWSDTVFQMGHAFIADGYQDSTFFHFNWGWGGSSDGYFNLNSLTPSGSDFTLLHEAIAYATPGGNYPVFCSGEKQMSNLQGCIEDGSGPLNNYADNLSCEWLIQPDDTVSYIEFELLKCNLASGDELLIFDGDSDSSGLLATFSGEVQAQSFQTSADAAFIRFVTDDSENGNGWLLSYNAVKPNFCSVIQNLTDSTGFVSDGSNAYPYQDQTYCNWFIMPEGAENIRLEFLEFDVADGDFVRIMDRANNLTLATLSGTQLPSPFNVYSDDVSITFDTDNSGVAQGWKLHYAMNVLSLKDKLSFKSLQMYPNPAEDVVMLNVFVDSKDFLSLKIISVDGKIQLTENYPCHFGQNKFSFSVETLPSGLYMIELSTEKNREIRPLQVVKSN